MFCEKCGNQVQSDSNYCQNCGNKIRRVVVNDARIDSPADDTSQGATVDDNRRWLPIIAAIAWLAAALAFAIENADKVVWYNKHVFDWALFFSSFLLSGVLPVALFFAYLRVKDTPKFKTFVKGVFTLERRE